MPRTLTAFIVLGILLAACGDGGSTTTAGATTLAGSPPVCQPLADVVRLSDDFDSQLGVVVSKMTQGAATPEEERQVLAEFATLMADTEPVVEELLAKYDAAAALADGDLRENIETVRETTAVIWPIFADSIDGARTFEEASDALTEGISDPEITAIAIAGGTAALAIDEFSVPNCGFKVSNS